MRLAALSAVVLVCLTPAAPATASPVVPTSSVLPSGPDWSVEPFGPGAWRVTWRSDRVLPHRDDVPMLVVDGHRLGVATAAADGRTLTATTTDSRVTRARSVGPAWSTNSVPDARDPMATAPDEHWATASGPFLDDDPGAPGPYAVTTRDYDLGDQALLLQALDGRVELRGRVYLPDGLTGRRPVVLLLHGDGAPCFGEPPVWSWPCGQGEVAVPHYLGYAAMANNLASRGYVVASVSADGVAGLNGDGEIGVDIDAGMRARGELLLATLDLVARGDRGSGPLDFLRQRADLDHIGLMGHSRGGEGVVRAALQNSRRPHPYGIRSVFLVAPTDFARLTLPGISTAVVLPYCDGDVRDLQGQHYLDDTRLVAPHDRSIKTSVLMVGANHSFFATAWYPGIDTGAGPRPAYDDGQNTCGPTGPGRLTEDQQRQAGVAYLSGFLGATLAGQRQYLPMFDGTGARARSAAAAVVRTTFTAGSRDRTDVATFDRTFPRHRDRGEVRFEACAGVVVPVVGTTLVDLPTTAAGRPACSDSLSPQQASHWSASPRVGGPPGTGVAHLTWSGAGTVRLPLARRHRDVRGDDALRLLIAPDPSVPGQQDLTVRVVDGGGRSVDVAVSTVSDALRPLPGGYEGLPRVQLRTVRIPMDRLAGIERRDVRAVELVADRQPKGAVFVGDIAFTRSRPGRSGPARLPELSLTGSPLVPEGAEGQTTAARFTVHLSRPSRRAVSFEWSAEIDTARRDDVRTDQSVVLSRTTRRVRIPAGRTSKVVEVAVRGNDRDGFDRWFTAGISAPRGALLGADGGTGRVLDDDDAPTATVGPASASEGDGLLRFPIQLSAPSDHDVFVDGYVHDGTALRGSDWEVEGGPGYAQLIGAVLRPGTTSAEADLLVIDDHVAEPTETLTFEPGGDNAEVVSPTPVVGTIVDDD
jgi:dienelactone hydrolase